jgi:hypothetical protein
MKYQYLIYQSKINLQADPPSINGVFSINIFKLGAKWMFDKLNENKNDKKLKFNHSINFFVFGLLKYGISFFAFLLSAILFSKINFFLIPLSIIIFYFAEIHFLFLFPILLDNVKKPIFTSIKQTYKTGVLTTLINVIPIGLYMIFGLLNIKAPFRNWYIGCLAIIIWYQNEIRNRI